MSKNRWTWQIDRLIPSNSDAGQEILDEIVRQLELSSWGQRDVFSVRLAVEEAIVNAIKHGNRYDPSKKVHVACGISPARLRIEIADEGPGFDPASVPDPTDEEHIDIPNGRGVMLMRSFMSSVSFNESGNQVIMEKCSDGCR